MQLFMVAMAVSVIAHDNFSLISYIVTLLFTDDLSL